MRSIRLTGAPPLDLVAVDIQRARDHGFPDYNQCRSAYGLPPYRTFAELTPDPAIKGTRMSDVIKRNTQITNIQDDVFHLPV
ncbi:peroxidase family protein [Streptomyces sp. NBC_00091]|uniref:peroxidase family protein n=1 Tax=Streptomyces sp. NBC_00091 TaxID=2975648 RepID=UPI00225B5A5A|nr:peroxidase family protein [Streptomyces sp. NBC_00091]MCX5376226.1 hypothetical protein [Streptomyces sp. NBC_00091]